MSFPSSDFVYLVFPLTVDYMLIIKKLRKLNESLFAYNSSKKLNFFHLQKLTSKKEGNILTSERKQLNNAISQSFYRYNGQHKKSHCCLQTTVTFIVLLFESQKSELHLTLNTNKKSIRL